MNIAEVAAQFDGARPSGDGFIARCPCGSNHNNGDSTPSLQLWTDDEGNTAICCISQRCPQNDILAAVGLTWRDLKADAPNGCATLTSKNVSKMGPKRKTFATVAEAVAHLEAKRGKRAAMWTYDSERTPIGVVVRWDKPDGSKDILPVSRHNDGWANVAMDEPRPLYRVDDVAGADVVYVVEGERCAEKMAALGFTATTSSGGSSAARKTDWRPLTGKTVAVFADADKPGYEYRAEVTAELRQLSPSVSVKWPKLPGLADDSGEDIADFIERHRAEGKTEDAIRDEIAALVEVATPKKDVVAPMADAMAGTSRPILLRMADIEPCEIRWLWLNQIPSGRITTVGGRPGLGKSFVTIDWAARVSTGTPWPDGSPCDRGSVIFITAEDDPAAIGCTPRRRVSRACAHGSQSGGC